MDLRIGFGRLTDGTYSTPFKEDTVFDAKLTAGELDPEEANLVEVFEDLSGGVVRDAGV